MNIQERELESCDVAVIGGALSGGATALLLKRKDPTLRIVVIEKNSEFKRRVGEATVEVSGYFLSRVLGLTNFLTQTQLCKNGLRFWFSTAEAAGLGECSEIGGKYLSTVPSFLIDRAVVDAEVLVQASAAGVEVWRPAQVLAVDLTAGGDQLLQVQTESGLRVLSARWVVDASGVRSLLARKNNWWQPNERHATLAGWSRWRGVQDWDSVALTERYPQLATSYVGIRGTATNHLIGDGWWAWSITLKGGDTSIGIVMDQRCDTWPEETLSVGDKMRQVLSQHAATRDMLDGAEFISGDVHFRRNLPYCSSVQAGDGFVLVGDASAFLDPFYSPGMDWIAFTSTSAVRLILAWRKSENLADEIKRHNRDFLLSYERMFEALYENKYEYMGDFELMRLAFVLDVGLYYLFVARTVFAGGAEALCEPPYSHRNASPIFALMRCYNRRFVAMARVRRHEGSFGATNSGERFLFPGFNFNVLQLFKTIFRALFDWGILEIKEGWKSWGKKAQNAAANEKAKVRVPV